MTLAGRWRRLLLGGELTNNQLPALRLVIFSRSRSCYTHKNCSTSAMSAFRTP
jgi:hypothetical protein